MNKTWRLQMPFEISFQSESYLWVVLKGELSFDDIRLSMEKITEDKERFKAVQYFIADYTQADMGQLTSAIIEKASNWLQKVTEINPDITLICIMGNILNYGMTRMWFIYAGEIPWKIMMVYNYKEFENLPLIKGHPKLLDRAYDD
jgi:hypothetical protein